MTQELLLLALALTLIGASIALGTTMRPAPGFPGTAPACARGVGGFAAPAALLVDPGCAAR